MKKILTALATAVLVAACLSMSVFASAVIFDAKRDHFAFETETYAYDMFENFKSVMPGDKLEQYVYIKYTAAEEVQTQLMIRSLGENSDNPTDLLSKLNLTVERVDNKKVLSDSKANLPGNLNEWYDLGTFKKGSDEPVVLKVTLEVPADLGNEYQNLLDRDLHKLTWELEAVDVTPEPEPMGDRVLTYSIIAVSTAAVALLAVVVFKKRSEE